MESGDPLAYFLTWPTYGTWLPGDGRGWVEYHRGWQLPDSQLELDCAARMTEDACRLQAEQRAVVEQQVAETCAYRGWTLHAVKCRSNHLHVVISAGIKPNLIRDQLKAWCTRRLKEHQSQTLIATTDLRTKWWAERGSIRWIWNEASLAAVIAYVLEQQDNPRRFLS